MFLLSLCASLILPAPVAAQPANPIDPAAVLALSDNYFTTQTEAGNIPGAFVVVMQRDRTLVHKAYGLADIDSETPMDANGGIYRLASVSKSLTNIAAYLLFRDRGLSLDDDIRKYLPDVAIDDSFAAPITIAQLMNHTDGFEEDYAKSLFMGDKAPSIMDYLQNVQPKRIFPPGAQLTYGSYGSILLGQIIANITGQSFEDYMDSAFFAPLLMTDTSFQQPMPGEIRARLFTEYRRNPDDKFTPVPLIGVAGSPAGAAYASGDDIVKLVRFFSTRGRGFLSGAEFEELITPTYSPTEGVPGITPAFFEHWLNGQTLMIRDGDGAEFRSRLVLIPDQDIALYLFYNTGDSKVRNDFLNAFMDRFFADPAPAPTSTADMPEGLSGSFRPIQANRSGLTKIQRLFVGGIRVIANGDRISIDPGEHGDVYGGFETKQVYRPIGGGVFQQENGPERVAFYSDPDSGQLFLASGRGYHGVFQRKVWWESGALNLAVALYWTLVLLAALGVFLVALVNRLRAKKRPVAAAISAMHWVLGGSVVLALIYVIAVNYILLVGDGDGFAFGIPVYFFAISDSIRWFIALPYLFVAGAFLALGLMISARGTMSGKGRFAMASVVLALILLGWQGWIWNLWA